MILAQALLFHELEREWRYDPDRQDPAYAQILLMFLDHPGAMHPFSIHNLLESGRIFKKRVGEWHGPNAACVMLAKCMEKEENEHMPRLVLADGGVLYWDQLRRACTDVELPPPGSDEWKEADGKEEDEEWRAVVILIPVRLGPNAKINPDYLRALLMCFQFPQSIGVIGGKPRMSLYFVGVQDENLFYLDPHTVQNNIPPPEKMEELLDHDKNQSFHCHTVSSMPASEIDPSLAIGFYCRNREDVEEFWTEARMLSEMSFPAFSVEDKPPTMDDLDFEDDDEANSLSPRGASNEDGFVVL